MIILEHSSLLWSSLPSSASSFIYIPLLYLRVCWCMWARPAAGQEVVIPKSDKMGSVPTQWTQTHRRVRWDRCRHTRSETTDMIYILSLPQSIMEIRSYSDIYCSLALLHSPSVSFCLCGPMHQLNTHTHTLSHEVILSKVRWLWLTGAINDWLIRRDFEPLTVKSFTPTGRVR